jgi:type IV pilus assembly protein PilV
MTSLLNRRWRGFSLLEVLVALVIISIGVLGVAAMQASALSNTHTSQNESLVAVQARSLADAMIANPAYWNSPGSPPASFVVTAPVAPSTVATVSDATLSAIGPGCTASACTTPSTVAAYDVQQWGKQLIPGSSASVTCVAGSPEVCTIQMQWTEKASIAVNAGTANSSSTGTVPMTYTLVNQM